MWTGLVFYHSRNTTVNEVLSTLLVLINAIFFLCGMSPFSFFLSW
jgi:hypothetical protein